MIIIYIKNLWCFWLNCPLLLCLKMCDLFMYTTCINPLLFSSFQGCAFYSKPEVIIFKVNTYCNQEIFHMSYKTNPKHDQMLKTLFLSSPDDRQQFPKTSLQAQHLV